MIRIIKRFFIFIVSIIIIVIVVISARRHSTFIIENNFSKGIDLSHWNIDTYHISLDSIPNDVSFVYLKATEGASYKDKMYPRYIEEFIGKNIGSRKDDPIKIGAYHFFKQNVPALLQFKNIKETVDSSEINLPIAIDFEFITSHSSKETKQIQECLYNLLIMVEKEYKKKPIIYCNTRGYDLFIRNCDKLNHYGIWLDAKSDNSLTVPNTIIKQIKIENNIDINVCYSRL